MSGDAARSIGTLAGETAVAAAWAQWSALAPAAVPEGRSPTRTIVDPEALVLLSLAVQDRERRLADLLAGWARAASALLSVQRLRTLAKEYPAVVRERVGDFARHAADAGDRRWRSHASDPGGGAAPRRKDPGPLRLVEGPALMLRLRAGFGVGAKADVLSYLLGLGGAAAELRAIVAAAGYSDRAVRTAAEEMALARFIHPLPGPRAAYRADPGAWGPVLEVRRSGRGAGPHPGLPRWHHWSFAFAFLADVVGWAEEAEREHWSEYVASSRARDLVEAHRERFRYLELDPAEDALGTAYLGAFRDVVEQVSARVGEHLLGTSAPDALR